MVGIALRSRRKLDLNIGRLREELRWRLGEQKEFHAADPGGQLVPGARDFDVFVIAYVTIEQCRRQHEFLPSDLAQFPHPNIAKAHRVSMILKRERLFLGVWLARRAFEPTGRAG